MGDHYYLFVYMYVTIIIKRKRPQILNGSGGMGGV